MDIGTVIFCILLGVQLGVVLGYWCAIKFMRNDKDE